MSRKLNKGRAIIECTIWVNSKAGMCKVDNDYPLTICVIDKNRFCCEEQEYVEGC